MVDIVIMKNKITVQIDTTTETYKTFSNILDKQGYKSLSAGILAAIINYTEKYQNLTQIPPVCQEENKMADSKAAL